MDADKHQLTDEERQELERYVTTGKRSVKLLKRGNILLLLDSYNGRKPKSGAEIAEHIGVSRQAVQTVKREYLAVMDIDSFLKRKKRETPPVPAKVTGELEAHIIALACSAVPEGYSKWGLRLLANKCVELNYVEELSHMTVSRVLKKHNLSLI